MEQVKQQPEKKIVNQRRILNVVFGDVHQKNIQVFKQLNNATLPIKYSDVFYLKVTYQYLKHTKLAYYNDLVVGSYCARKQLFEDVEQSFYILTFGVLEPYQKYGIGKQLMKHLLQSVKEDKQAKLIYLHMHVKNQKGKIFYQRCGFKIIKRIDQYYTDIQEPHAYLMVFYIENDTSKE